MARTTLALDPTLLRQLKLRAVREGSSLQQVVNDLLRQALSAPPAPFRLELGGWDGIQDPSLDLFDRNSMFEFMEEGSR